MNVWQRKIDDQRSVFQRVLPPKNALQTKRPVFYSPGEFTGRGSEAHLHKRKAEILRFRVKRELSSNLPPKRKNRPEDRSAENQENGRGERTGYHFKPFELKSTSKISFTLPFVYQMCTTWYHKLVICGCPQKLDNLTWCKMPVKLT